MPGVRFVYLDVADWQDCTKSPQISTLPQILLRGRQEDTERVKDSKTERPLSLSLSLKNEHKEMGRERKRGHNVERRSAIKWD